VRFPLAPDWILVLLPQRSPNLVNLKVMLVQRVRDRRCGMGGRGALFLGFGMPMMAHMRANVM